MSSTVARRVAAGLAVVYAGCAAFIVFWPSSTPSSDSVNVMTEGLYGLGFPDWISRSMVEFAANIALFVPLSLLGSVLLDRWGWKFWLLAGLAASGAIELGQLLFLGGRSATVVDVVANTLGAVAGAVVAGALRTRLPDS